jgi:hypothetical protein
MGQWRYRKVVKLPDGSRERISGTPSRNTREAAEQAERGHIDRVLFPAPIKKEVPTFGKWFWGDEPESSEPSGRFWNEWVVASKNKPGDARNRGT